METGMDAMKNKIEYMVIFIAEFAKAHHLSEQEAYRYLKDFGAIDVIDKCYEVMHTQSFDDMVADMTTYCNKRGGKLQ